MNQFANKSHAIYEGKRMGIYNASRKLCLVVGAAPNFLQDIEDFKAEFPEIPFDVMAINGTVKHIEKVEHYCSCHPLACQQNKWEEFRTEKGWENNFKSHSLSRYTERNKAENVVDYSWNLWLIDGSSSLVGIFFAMGMGYRGVITCGVELTGKYEKYRKTFKLFSERYPEYIKQMSGVLKCLGKPTKEWIEMVVK